MRINLEKKHQRYFSRIIEKFLWFPAFCSDSSEVRWLERAKIKQFYAEGIGWRNERFLSTAHPQQG